MNCDLIESEEWELLADSMKSKTPPDDAQNMSAIIILVECLAAVAVGAVEATDSWNPAVGVVDGRV